jgi:hypothetical protein
LLQTDVFQIWWVAVAAIGYSVMFDISKTKGAVISITLWAISVLGFLLNKTIGLAGNGVETSFF